MHGVAFRIGREGDRWAIEIFVDDRPLQEYVRSAEARDAALEGHPDLAGKCGGLPREVLDTDLLLGSPTGIWAVLEANRTPSRVPLLLCECGEPGCWPLMATIEVTNDSVVWKDFRQPHRNKWNHESLGPFTFDRAQYLAALTKVPSVAP